MNYLPTITIALLLMLGVTSKIEATANTTSTKTTKVSKPAKHPTGCSCSSCRGGSQKTHKQGCSCSQCRRH